MRTQAGSLPRSFLSSSHWEVHWEVRLLRTAKNISASGLSHTPCGHYQTVSESHLIPIMQEIFPITQFLREYDFRWKQGNSITNPCFFFHFSFYISTSFLFWSFLRAPTRILNNPFYLLCQELRPWAHLCRTSSLATSPGEKYSFLTRLSKLWCQKHSRRISEREQIDKYI